MHITLCQRCADVPQFIRAERYLWEYTPQARAVIHHMKYGPSLRLAGWLGREFGAHSSQLGLFLDWTHIVPIPGNPAHVAVRGFDQAQVIAASFLRSLSLKSSLLRTNLFTRPHAAKAQAETQHRDRFKNSLQSLSLKKRPWPGARVLLIDDVSTTGATAWHAAQLLRRAGAARVDVLTVARASSWGEFHFKRLALLSTKS